MELDYCPYCGSNQVVVDDIDGESSSLFHSQRYSDIYVYWFNCEHCKESFGVV